MWRSIVSARASVSRNVARNLSALDNPNLKVPSSKTLNIVQSQHLSTWMFSPGSSICLNQRFFSLHSANCSDFESQITKSSEDGFVSSESLEFGENSNTQIDDLVAGYEIPGVLDEASAENVDTQIDSFSPENGIHEGTGDSHAEDSTHGSGEEDEVYEIDVEQLESVLSLLQSRVDGSFESSLDNMGLTLHEDFVVKVLETPLILGENLIGFFRWAMKSQSEFKVTARVVDALVCAICNELKRKDAYSLWDLIKEIGEKENGSLNTQILNELIALFSKLGKGKAALEVFNKLGDFGCVPNADTYYYTIEALCRRSIYYSAQSVCEKMLDAGSLPDSERVGSILSWLCKGEKAKDAHLVYTLAKERNCYPPRWSVYFLVSSLGRKDETIKLALEMLDDFSGELRKYAIKPFSSVLRGLSMINNNNEAKELLSKMIADGPPPGNAAFNTVINGYSKTGDLEEAMKLMKLMESRGLKPDVYTYTVIISGFVKGGQMEEACEVLSEAKKKHCKLSPVTYHTLIRGYCKLEEYDKALHLLAEMKNFGVQPNIDEYNKLIQSLCLKALDWKTAEKLLDDMKENGLYLSGITRGLITAVKELEEEEVGKAELNLTA